MFFKKFMSSAAVTALGLAAATSAYAQETTSSVRGTIISDTGQGIAGAEITVIHVPSGSRSATRTDASGAFNTRGLRVGGPYTIEVSATNFESRAVDNLFFTVGDPAEVVIDLFPAGQEIVVTAVSPRSGATGSSTTLGREAIDSVVSVNRDIRDLARRDPLVSQNARGDGGISIAGSNPRTNQITIDGVQAQDDFGLNTGGFPTRRGPVSLDAIGQFAVEAVPFDVENGDFLGGGLNIILADGGNEFQGSAFVKYINEGLVGTRLQGQAVRAQISQENYGATFRGPVIPNVLNFALSYENFSSFDATTTGPAGLGFANTITGPAGAPMTQANIDAVTSVFSSPTFYNSTFAVGGITLTKPITDEKYSARFDWNIAPGHRANVTYRYAESGLIQRTNLGQFSAGLDSQWYLTGEEDAAYALQINSDWTEALSTEFRYSKREYNRAQMPPSGQSFADIRVCSTLTNADAVGQSFPLENCRNGSSQAGVVRFGPDQFRHANELATTNTQYQFSGEYVLGDHLLKAGVQLQTIEINNLFVPNSDGTYYFDSITDFQQGRANVLDYRNALTGNPRDAAALFSYDVTTYFLQDSWDITDSFTLNYGVRFDSYAVDRKPARNPNFTVRNPGQNNQVTYDGIEVLMPRVSFKWDPIETLRVSGGFGLFSGGLPDVFLSNVYSNTGILDNTIRIVRNADGTFSETTGSAGFTQAIGSAALNVPVNSNFGRSANFPASVQAFLAGAGAPIAAETNVLAPGFDMPSDWKANLSLRYDVWDDWRLTFDGVFVRSEVNLAFRDARAIPLIVNGVRAVTPDGRLRYDGLSTAQRTSIVGATVAPVPTNIPVVTSGSSAGAPGGNRDIQAYNPGEENTAWTVALGIGKEFENGLSVNFVYTLQEIEDFSTSARFSSTASSLYGGQFASIDPNTAVKGTSQEQVDDAFKLELGFRHNFFGDLETRFTLFGEDRAGRRSSFTMSAGGGRNPTFGVNRGAQLAYVPNMTGSVSQIAPGGAWQVSSDSRVAFDTALTADNLRSMIRRFDIPQGGIVPRGTYENERVSQWDFQFSQELPAFAETHRTLFTIDIQNVANMLNDEWGIIEEFGEDFRLFDVSCAGNDGLANAAGILSCTRYRISSVNTGATEARNTDRSRWTILLGLKYEF
jgi:outer membrane receptor protein involved in Fe transport